VDPRIWAFVQKEDQRSHSSIVKEPSKRGRKELKGTYREEFECEGRCNCNSKSQLTQQLTQ
jgi:hypothetical protein